MSSIATLRATNCARLAALNATHVAAYGPKTAYVYDTEGKSCGSFTAPREADCFVLHRIARVGRSDVALLYAASRTEGEGSAFFLKLEGEEAATPLTVAQPPAGRVIELYILNGSFLVARTAAAVVLYSLEGLAAETETLTGGNVALPQVGDAAVAEDATAYVHMKGNELVVASCKDGRLRAQVLAVSPSSCATVCQTPAEGILLPAAATAAVELLSWAQNWRRMELVLLTREAAGTPSLHTLSLLSGMWVTDRSAPWPDTVLEGTRDIIATSDGALWGVDKTSGPLVTLRRASSASAVELAGTSATANVLVTEAGDSLFVLCGKSLFRVEKDIKEPTLHDWLAKAVAEDSVAQGDAATAVLQFVKGTSASFESVVHDTAFVQHSEASASFTHEILQSASRLDSHASLRYVALAHSFHWYTALRVLQQPGDDGLVLAVAALLARKRAQDGRDLLGDAQQAATAFFAEPAFDATAGARKLYIASLCRAMRTALTVGALDALGVLCAVADAAVTAVYTSEQWRDEVPPLQEGGGDAEITIASTISLLSSYADWAVQAGSMLGAITAHVGPARTVKKEAMLLDGRAHPIRTSRHVEIKPFLLDKKKRS